jgi:hypothetical protein
MAGEKPGGHDRLPQATRATDHIQKLLFETVHDEPKGKLEGTFERGLFPIHLHEGTFRLPGLSHRKEIVGSPSVCPAPSGRQTLIFSVLPAVHA